MSDFISYLGNGLAVGCGFSLLASGLVLVNRVTRVMNLTQGMLAVLGGFSAATLLDLGVPHGLSELSAVLLAALSGGVVGAVAIGKRGTSPQSSLIVTLGLGILAYGVEMVLWGDQPRSFSGLPGVFDVAGVALERQYALIVVVTALVFVLLEVFLERTDLGKALSACASNPYAARLVGIDVTKMGILAFSIGGALGGLAGVLLTPLRPVSFDADVSLLVDGFAAAILGGLRSPRFALAGGLVLGVSEAMVAGYLKASLQTEVALVLMLAIMVRRADRRFSLLEEQV